MKKLALGMMVALIAVSLASPALADNDREERGEKRGQSMVKEAKKLSKWLHWNVKSDKKNADSCVADAKTAYNTSLKNAFIAMQTAQKNAHQARVAAITAANGNQPAIDAAWSAYRSAITTAWSAYSNAVFAAMNVFGSARSACPIPSSTPTPSVTPSAAKAITSFNLATPSAVGIINETAHTIALTVPYGTNVSALAPTIAHTGASVSPSSGVAQNFGSPVTYTVTAANGTTQAYVVTVNVALNTAKAITGFTFGTPAAVGVINESAHTIAVSVPNGTSVSTLVPTISISGVSVSPASGVAQNFTGTTYYTVTAADSSYQTYAVTVTVQQ